jgi:starvation-inducible DNA-binding protein
MTTHATLPEKTKSGVAEGLSRLLADTYALYLKTHGYHWNVTGPMFPPLHLLFEAEYNELWLAADLIAERIRTLGVKAPASYAEFAALASISDDPGAPDAMTMVRRLREGHEAVLRTIRAVLPAAQDTRDEASVNLLTARLEVHEKTAWMLRSMLEK